MASAGDDTGKAALSIVWLRRDLRLADNPALDAACRIGGTVIPIYIYCPEEAGKWPPGAASRYWLHQSLASLDKGLHRQGSRLILRRGASLDCLLEIASTTGAKRVYWNECYEPATRKRDAQVAVSLRQHGLEIRQHTGGLLMPVERLRTKSDGPYQVFTPYYNAFMREYAHTPPLPVPAAIRPPAKWPESLPLAGLKLEPSLDWAGGIRGFWSFGEAAAHERLQRFALGASAHYHNERDMLAFDSTSRLSPYLANGELSPRQVWDVLVRNSTPGDGQAAFLRQLVWREFAYHLLWHFPATPEQPLRAEFACFPWREDAGALERWQHGQTGYPLVDAAMRQLWQTGWMQNRARMVAASFLTKHLLLPWQLGAHWFWDTLVDADLANNTFGWQWTAGCGADAAPYFRIFNPVRQAEKFDPAGEYVARYVPEASDVLGGRYRQPIIEHRFARERALAAYAEMKQGR